MGDGGSLGFEAWGGTVLGDGGGGCVEQDVGG